MGPNVRIEDTSPAPVATVLATRARATLCASGTAIALLVNMTVERRARRRHIDNTERRSWGPDSAAALAEKRILVVDDDPDTRLFLRHLFRRVRAVVQEASSAVDAFASLRDFKPQLVISDIDMPIEDGCTLMRRIRELGADNGGLTPSIALTANEGTAERRKALQAGFNAYLTKPVAVASLIDTAATALR